ncbi:MAG: AarF/ABC1/UbiB kinase family protein [Myxococcaceae bacterium]
MAGDTPSGGRFKRLAKLAGLGARLSTDLATRGVKRLSGETAGILSSAGAEKLVSTLGELKGLAMKVGQSLAMDPDLLTPEVQAIVAKLQNQAPPMHWDAVQGVLTRELGDGALDRFLSVDAAPMASASLGQVHQAVLKNGERAVVKVQYPGVDKALEADLSNIESTAVLLAKAAGVPAQSYFAEIRESLLEELDYRLEATHAEQMRVACAGAADLVVPKVILELSAQRVITEEKLEGETLKDFLARKATASNEERFQVARMLIRGTFVPFFSGNVIHADPHPGNYVLMSGGKLGLLDFGNVRKVTDTWVGVNRELLHVGLGRNRVDFVDLTRRAGFTIDAPDDKVRPFIDGMMELVLEPMRTATFDYGTAKTLQRLRAHSMKHMLVLKTKLQPPPEGLLFYRAMGGLVQNLQSLGAAGPYREVYEGLAAL